MHDASLRPANLRRSALHVFSGLAVLALIQLVLTPKTMVLVAAGFALAAWTMEISRRRSAAFNRFIMWVFGPVAHPHEVAKVNSATWYTTALFGLSLTASPMACAVAVTVLGVGDPAAGVVGRRFGSIRLATGRSLEGTAAFVVCAGAATFGMLRLFYPEVALPGALAVALVAAAAGGVAELFARRLDDNFVIPLAAAAAATVVAALL